MPGRWIGRPQKPRWILPAATLTILLSQAPSWINLFTNPGRHVPALRYAVGAIVLLALAIGIGAMVRSRLRDRLGKTDATLLDGAFGEQFPAEITIVAGKKPLGSDRGVIWFADGLIGFSGRSASFVLAARDVAVPWTARAANTPVGPAPIGSLVLVDAPVPAYVAISPLGDHTKALRERLRLFENETAAPDAERHWPPLEAYEALATANAALS